MCVYPNYHMKSYIARQLKVNCQYSKSFCDYIKFHTSPYQLSKEIKKNLSRISNKRQNEQPRTVIKPSFR